MRPSKKGTELAIEDGGAGPQIANISDMMPKKRSKVFQRNYAWFQEKWMD
ncbi:hypothetical protein pah_c258o001 [Parachlamydia acanthamoebae str. Hall's coccus]|nr:hypothetical protein pah_c258o001 [Parachlamydia acanthamoebae str. Hall's coccus]